MLLLPKSYGLTSLIFQKYVYVFYLKKKRKTLISLVFSSPTLIIVNFKNKTIN